MTNIFNRENLPSLLIFLLIGHNIYLQFRFEDAVDAAKDAAYYSSEASENASDAASYASDAADNAFGNECWSCPKI